VKAVEEQARRGITLMLPSEDAVWVGEELQRRFGLPYWQFTLTATDANRFSIRLARQITGRPKILVFNGAITVLWMKHSPRSTKASQYLAAATLAPRSILRLPPELSNSTTSKRSIANSPAAT